MTYLTCRENECAQSKVAANTVIKKLDLMQIFHPVGNILKGCVGVVHVCPSSVSGKC